MDLVKLLLLDGGGGAHHDVLCILVHRERNDLADGVLACQQHDHAVDARRDACMRGCTIAESVVHGRELGLDILLAQTNQLKGLDHDLRVVVPDRAGGQLHTVADQIVLEGIDAQGVNFAALGLTPGSFVGVTAGKKTAAQKTAGVLRKLLGAAVPGHMDAERYEFCWIVDFPMYEIGDESGELEFCHNPFSMPGGGAATLDKAIRGEIDPLTITAQQYDLVCNGIELSSGAVRNHDPEIMIKAFQLVRLGEDDVKKKFPAMYNAFCYGAPPHAGIAPGIDRMVMLLAGEDCIREIIPFPMNKNAQDILMGAPSEVTQKQLDELHIRCTAKEED